MIASHTIPFSPWSAQTWCTTEVDSLDFASGLLQLTEIITLALARERTQMSFNQREFRITKSRWWISPSSPPACATLHSCYFAFTYETKISSQNKTCRIQLFTLRSLARLAWIRPMIYHNSWHKHSKTIFARALGTFDKYWKAFIMKYQVLRSRMAEPFLWHDFIIYF